MDLMSTLMANARQAAGVQAKPSGDNATVPGKDTKTQGDGVVPAALAGIPNLKMTNHLSQVSLICGKLMQVK